MLNPRITTNEQTTQINLTKGQPRKDYDTAIGLWMVAGTFSYFIPWGIHWPRTNYTQDRSELELIWPVVLYPELPGNETLHPEISQVSQHYRCVLAQDFKLLFHSVYFLPKPVSSSFDMIKMVSRRLTATQRPNKQERRGKTPF